MGQYEFDIVCIKGHTCLLCLCVSFQNLPLEWLCFSSIMLLSNSNRESFDVSATTNLSDIEILKIAENVTVDLFYDLGVALGFTITELDNIEYRRFRNREEATLDMLFRWRQRQPSNDDVKQTLINICDSVNAELDETFDGKYKSEIFVISLFNLEVLQSPFVITLQNVIT